MDVDLKGSWKKVAKTSLFLAMVVAGEWMNWPGSAITSCIRKVNCGFGMKNDSQLNRALHISRSNCSITCNGVASCLHIYYDISSMDWSGFIKGGSTRVYVVAWCLRINILEEFSECPHSCALKWLNDNWQWFHCNFCDFNNLNPASSGQRSAQENWLDRKVQTVSVDDVEYITCEHVGKDRRSFKLKPEKDSVSLTLKLMGRNQTIGRIRITQFGVNSNIATTGHKLQGTPKNNLIVATWNYSYPHWIYVVLSRVRKLKGLFLCQKLDEKKPFPVIREVGIEEERLKEIETEILAKWERRHDDKDFASGIPTSGSLKWKLLCQSTWLTFTLLCGSKVQCTHRLAR